MIQDLKLLNRAAELAAELAAESAQFARCAAQCAPGRDFRAVLADG